MEGKRLKIAVLSGAGISAESGIQTFRDSDGLWENYRVEDVCTPEALERNPELVIGFYNQRLAQVLKAQPNSAHRALVRLEEKYEVDIITQNIDDLHERAGSTRVLHLHGDIRKKRSQADPLDIRDIEPLAQGIRMGDLDRFGMQYRPHIVFFGEAVPNIEPASRLVEAADIVVIIGTSLQVYPAAGLMYYAAPDAPIYYIDPKADEAKGLDKRVVCIAEKAGKGVPEWVDRMLDSAR
ncbi:MAG: NAD-dependent deacylase [Bacteroidales bacterium]|nr:NAD-dependent deacylase [Bacteroidales bacterium]